MSPREPMVKNVWESFRRKVFVSFGVCGLGRFCRRANFFGSVSKIFMGWVADDARRWCEFFEVCKEFIGLVYRLEKVFNGVRDWMSNWRRL